MGDDASRVGRLALDDSRGGMASFALSFALSALTLDALNITIRKLDCSSLDYLAFSFSLSAFGCRLAFAKQASDISVQHAASAEPCSLAGRVAATGFCDNVTLRVSHLCLLDRRNRDCDLLVRRLTSWPLPCRAVVHVRSTSNVVFTTGTKRRVIHALTWLYVKSSSSPSSNHVIR